MDVVVYFLILALLFPTFPLSLPVSFTLQRFGKLRSFLIMLLPILGFFLYSYLGKPAFPQWALWIGMGSSLLYAFRALSVKSLKRWLVYHYVSVFSLMWIFLSRAEVNLVFVAGTALVFLSLSLLTGVLESIFGTTNPSFLRGLGAASPVLSFILVVSVLLSVALPTSSLFFSLLASSLLLKIPEFLLLACIWFLWGWSGLRLISSLITGSPRPDLSYEGVDAKTFLLLSFINLAVLLLGFLFLEVLL
ncbi:hypothetical protein [Hydrogenivirga sp.]